MKSEYVPQAHRESRHVKMEKMSWHMNTGVSPTPNARYVETKNTPTNMQFICRTLTAEPLHGNKFPVFFVCIHVLFSLFMHR